METEYDAEILDYITGLPYKINFSYSLDSDAVQQMETIYPMGFNGIAWENVKERKYLDLKNINEETKRKKIQDFFNELKESKENLENSNVIAFGDGLTNLYYRFSFKDFQLIKHAFFCLPQSTYVFFPDIKKCINMTFEDDMFFG
jgi:hypothetical protein